MEGSSRFHGSKKPHYQYLYEPLVQKRPSEGEPSSKRFTRPRTNNCSEPRNIFRNEVHGNCPKWTDEMARLLITVVSYIMEVASSELDDDGSTQRFKFMPNMTKWEVVSTVMIERGYNVSPQQCTEKFGEIKKKYERMIGILGRPTSCNVVENPTLLDSIEMPERQKEEVRRLLSSDQFLYREMCSLRNGNRLFLPHDWELRRLVFLSLADIHVEEHVNLKENLNERNVLRARIQLEEKKLEMLKQRLQFELMRFEWQRSDHSEEFELEKMRLENERLKLTNARLAFELKRRETAVSQRRD